MHFLVLRPLHLLGIHHYWGPTGVKLCTICKELSPETDAQVRARMPYYSWAEEFWSREGRQPTLKESLDWTLVNGNAADRELARQALQRFQDAEEEVDEEGPDSRRLPSG